MDSDPSSKKRKRSSDIGSADIELEPATAGAPAQVVSAVPAKKVMDVAALKAKMAETKRKLEEMKAASQAGAQDKPSNASTSSSTSLASSASGAGQSISVAPATTSAHARYLNDQQDKRAKEQRKAEKETSKPEETLFDPSFDPRLKRATADRKARPLVFLQPGELTKRAEVQNQKIEKMVVAKQVEEHPSETTTSVRRPRPSPVTETTLEWWDQPYVAQSSTDGAANENSMAVDSSDRFDSVALKEDMITLIIHHPVLTTPAAEAAEPAPRALMLTPDQERQLAKQKRRLALDTRKEEILLGLRPVEKGRVKLSNMVKVFSDAITDPTLVERRVREEEAARKARHFARNAERQLTPEQRKAKEAEKRKEDTSLASTVAVFRIMSLENPKNRFKVDAEVKKNNLSGVAVYSSEFVILAVEGGPKSIARFTKKMLKVAWTQPLPISRDPVPAAPTEPAAGSSTEEKDKNKERIYGKKIAPEDNTCYLVWKGEVLRRSFTEFRFVMPSQGSRAYLNSLGVAHYYDAALNYVPTNVIL